MFTQVTISLADDERKALQVMAQNELRGLKEQIRFILREAIFNHGMLVAVQQITEVKHGDQSSNDIGSPTAK